MIVTTAETTAPMAMMMTTTTTTKTAATTTRMGRSDGQGNDETARGYPFRHGAGGGSAGRRRGGGSVVAASSPRMRKITTALASTASSSFASSEAFESSSDNDATGSSSCSSDDDASAAVQQPVPVPGEPHLFHIPSNVSPTYRTVPLGIRAAIVITSGILSSLLGAAPLLRIRWLRNLAAAAAQLLGPITTAEVASRIALMKGFSWKRLIMWAVRAVLISTACVGLLQDKFYGPSRISLDDLVNHYHLPSPLSKLDSATGLHYLEYVHKGDPTNINAVKNGEFRYDALYVNHGFGASSLSFLPCLPTLVHDLRCRAGYGHDAPGFGFSRRGPRRYRFVESARLGHQLLVSQISNKKTSTNDHRAGAMPSPSLSHSHPESVLFVGHSMGSITSLHMASLLPPECRVDVVLVAPALGIRRHPHGDDKSRHASNTSTSTTTTTTTTTTAPLQSNSSRIGTAGWELQGSLVPALEESRLGRVRRAVARRITQLGHAVARYGLRRLVGRRHFWKNGLKLAWGDPDKVTDSDALRFQWPSILEGWEQGLLDFAGSQRTSTSECMDDLELVRRVLERPNTRLFVILGGKDRVVSGPTIAKFFESFPRVRCEVMEGLGHDPFEEDPSGFVRLVQAMLHGEAREW